MRRQSTVTVLLDPHGRPRAFRQPAYLLRVVKGPDRRKQLTVTAPRLRVGTDGAGFALTDPTVSAVHCELLADETGFRVRDLGAKNGTWLRERRLGEAWLESGDDLVLGRTTVRFKLLDEVSDQPLSERSGFGRLLGRSARMRALYAELERVAQGEVTVLLEGETGVGKDLCAEALVSEGPRKAGPLVVVDCARLPPSLAESELFGHVAGAFTGASRDFPGAFERAHGGTVFLDAVDELALELQPKLLGVLERRSVRRLGGHSELPVDVRVIAATRIPLERAVNQGRFRADLFYRLAVVQLHVPPLREHAEDVPELVAHFLEELGRPGSLAPSLLERLYAGRYPGNVRELRNAVERAVVGVQLEPSPLAAAAPDAPPLDWALSYREQKERAVDAFERRYVAALLEASGGNVSEAARRAKMDRMYLHKLIRRLGLGP